jgi:hypothetical protein
MTTTVQQLLPAGPKKLDPTAEGWQLCTAASALGACRHLLVLTMLMCTVLQDIINEVNTLAHQAKAKLEQVDKLNTAAQQKKGQGVGSASERTRTSITSGAHSALHRQQVLLVCWQDSDCSACQAGLLHALRGRSLIESSQQPQLWRPAHRPQQNGATVHHMHRLQQYTQPAASEVQTCGVLCCLVGRPKKEVAGPDGGVQ